MRHYWHFGCGESTVHRRVKKYRRRRVLHERAEELQNATSGSSKVLRRTGRPRLGQPPSYGVEVEEKLLAYAIEVVR